MSIDFNNPANLNRISSTGILQAKATPAYTPKPIDMSFLSAGLGKPDPTHVNPDKAMAKQDELQQQQIDLQKEQFLKSQELSNKQMELSYYQYAQSVKQGNKKSGKVLCTRMYELGFMSKEIFEVDQRYGKIVFDANPQLEVWYHQRALFFLRFMHNQTLFSKVFIRLSWLLIKPWSEHMAYKMGYLKEDNKFGEWLMNYAHKQFQKGKCK